MKLIILDRDGVINQESSDYIKSTAEWLPIPGSLEAIARLTAADYTIVVATNQSGVARKYFSLEDLQEIHESMLEQVMMLGGEIHKVYYCPHSPTDNCSCRKPRTGMFEQIAADLSMDFEDQKFSASANIIFVGDSLCDVELGLATNCKFYLTAGFGSHGDDTLTKLTPEQRQQITMVKDLTAVVDMVLA